MSAPDLRAALMEIHDRHGRLTPTLVVEEARAEDHPLHAAVFDRPPEQAAEAWYLERAHRLIRKVRISYLPPADDAPEQSIRAFQAVRTSGPPGAFEYKPTEVVAQDPFLTQLVLRDMERDWRQLKARWGSFSEFVVMVRGDLEEDAAA